MKERKKERGKEENEKVSGYRVLDGPTRAVIRAVADEDRRFISSERIRKRHYES